MEVEPPCPAWSAKGDIAIGRYIAGRALDVDREPVGVEFFRHQRGDAVIGTLTHFELGREHGHLSVPLRSSGREKMRVSRSPFPPRRKCRGAARTRYPTAMPVPAGARQAGNCPPRRFHPGRQAGDRLHHFGIMSGLQTLRGFVNARGIRW